MKQHKNLEENAREISERDIIVITVILRDATKRQYILPNEGERGIL
jgi:hypothetical protein